MAGVNIPEDMLAPGDKVEISYRIKGGNDVLTMMAVNEVEKRLDREEWWDLWRYRFETRDRQPYVVFTLRCREVSKWDSENVRVYEAGVAGALVAVAVGLSLLAGALVAYAYLEREGYVILRKILEDPDLSPEQKKAAVDYATGKGGGITATIASLGTGGLIVAGLILYAMFSRPRRSVPGWE